MRLAIILLFFSVACAAQLPDSANTGTAPNFGDGDPLRIGTQKLNARDNYLSGRTTELSDSVIENIEDIILRVLTDADLRDSIINLWTRIIALEKEVFNIKGGDATLQLYYKFEQNVLDETAYLRNGTASGFSYSDLNSESNYFVGNFDTITSYVTTPSFDHTSDFTVMADVIIGNDSSGVRTIAGNMASSDGWKLQFDYDSFQLQFVTGNGSTDTVKSAQNAFRVDTIFPHHVFRIGVTSDGTMYKNGVEITTTGDIQSGFESSATIRIGSAKDNSECAYCYLDNFKVYDGVVDSAGFYDEYFLNEYYEPGDVAPVFYGGAVSTGAPGQVRLSFSEPLYNYDSDSTFGAFSYAINDSTVTIDSSEYQDGNFILYTDSCEYGNILKLSYSSTYYSGLEDFEGNKLSSFFAYSITNNLAVPGADSVPLAVMHHLFEQNLSDDINDYDISIPTGGTTYATDFSPQGTYSLASTGSAKEIYLDTAYNSDELPDKFTVMFRYRFAVSELNTELFRNDVHAAAGEEGMMFYVNGSEAAQGDFILIGETVNSGNEMRWNNKCGAGGCAGLDYHIAFTFDNTTGRAHMYIDGVENTSADSLLDSDIDLSGKWRLMASGGNLDDFVFYDRLLSNSAIATAAATPGLVIYGPGSDTITPIGGDFLEYAVPLFDMLDFEDYSIGGFPESSMATLLDPYASTYVKASGYSSGISAYWPDIASYDYDSAGTRSSKGLKLYHPEGLISTENNNEFHYGFFPPDASNIDVYLTYNVHYVPSVAWDNMTYHADGTVDNWKHNGMAVFYDERLIDPIISNTLYRAASVKMVGKPRPTGDENRWVTYTKGGWTILWDIQDLKDPDDQSSNYFYTDAAENLHNITIRMCLYDIDDPTHGFFEFFIDGKFSFRYDKYPFLTGQPFKIVDAEQAINGFILKYHQNWGPVGSSADLIYDDIVMFRYRMDFRNGDHWCKKSSSTRKLLLPNWDTDGGYKTTINQ